MFLRHKPEEYMYPLKYLPYCSNLKVLLLGNRFGYHCYKKVSKSQQLPYTEIKNCLYDVDVPDSKSKSLKELTSVFYKYIPEIACFSQKNYFQFLEKLPNLQEIYLKLDGTPKFNFTKLFKSQNLQNVKLKVNLPYFENLPQILNSLKDSKITAFSLSAFGVEKKSLASLAKFLKNSPQLQTLKLNLMSNPGESQTLVKDFSQISKEINQLKNLRHLKLSVNEHYEEPPVKNFFKALFPLTTLETLHLSSNLLEYEKAFPEIMTWLTNLSPRLSKLTLVIGDPSTGQLSQNIALNFIRSLINVRVLKLPGLYADTNQILNKIVDTVLDLKNLEVFCMGDIEEEEVTGLGFLIDISSLLDKKGLRRFSCNTDLGLYNEISIQITRKVDQLKRNSYVEEISLIDEETI